MVDARLLVLALAAGLTGCGGPAALPSDCEPVAIAALAPGTAAFVAPGAALSLTTDPPDADVSVWVDGGLAPRWVPLLGPGPSRVVPLESPIEPGHTYTARIQRCGVVQAEASFTSLPPRQGTAVLGKTWLIDLRDPALLWTEPPAAPPITFVDMILGDKSGVLFAPLRIDGDTLDAGLTLAETLTGRLRQDPCLPPAILPGIDWSADPMLTIALDRLDLEADNTALLLENVRLEGVFDAQGTILRALRLSMALDTRTLGGLAAQSCALLETLVGATCVACEGQPVQDEPRCLLLDVTSEVASAQPDLSFTETPVPDVSCR